MVGCVGWMAYSLQLWGQREVLWRKPFYYGILIYLLRSKRGNLHRFLKYVHFSWISDNFQRWTLPGILMTKQNGSESTGFCWKKSFFETHGPFFKAKSGWWFQIFFHFHLYLGKWSNFTTQYFSNALKPPTRKFILLESTGSISRGLVFTNSAWNMVPLQFFTSWFLWLLHYIPKKLPLVGSNAPPSDQ